MRQSELQNQPSWVTATDIDSLSYSVIRIIFSCGDNLRSHILREGHDILRMGVSKLTDT